MKKNILHNILITLTILIVSTLICFLLDLLNLDIMNFMIIYVLGILICAIFTTGYIQAISLSLLSVLAFNIFFTVPRYTFKVDDPKYIVTILLVMLVEVIISSIVYRLKTYTKRVNDLKIEQLKIKNNMEKEQIKSTMLRGISHDLRTPLTTIKNGIEIILKDNISKDEKIEVGKKVSQKCDWTIKLMNNLLSLTRINGEDFTVKKNPELVEEVLSEAIRNLEDL